MPLAVLSAPVVVAKLLLAIAPSPPAKDSSPVDWASGPTAVLLLTPVATELSPSAAPPFEAVALTPRATEPVAEAPVPMAMALTPVEDAPWPTASEPAMVAWELSPMAMEVAVPVIASLPPPRPAPDRAPPPRVMPG